MDLISVRFKKTYRLDMFYRPFKMADAITITPDEIKPFVAVGPTEDFSVTVHKSTFDTGFIIITILFFVVFAVVLTVSIIFAVQSTQIQTSTLDPVPSVVITDGSALSTQEACTARPNTTWTGDRCQCVAPFTGPLCTLEPFDHANFVAAGIPNEERINMQVLSEHLGTKSTCSDACVANDDCSGFIHRGSNCTLVTGDVVVAENDSIAYSDRADPTLYMKSMDSLKFTGRIYLAEFAHNLPPRPWLVRSQYHYRQLFPRELVAIDFFPNVISVHGCYLGIYSLAPFDLSDIPGILDAPNENTTWIHHPRTPLMLPDHWRYHLPIHVMVIPA